MMKSPVKDVGILDDIKGNISGIRAFVKIFIGGRDT